MSQAFANVDRKPRGAERRIFRRRRVRSLAYVELGQGNGGIVLNVSEGGLAVQAVMAVAGDELPDMRLQLAHSSKEIRAKGKVTWTGEFRKLAGIEFVDLSVEALRQLREWIALEEPEQQPAETTSWKPLEAGDSTIQFPPHLGMPDILPCASVPGTPTPGAFTPSGSVSSVPGSSRPAAGEANPQSEVTLPRRNSISAQERAAILGKELEGWKEPAPAGAELIAAPTRSSSPFSTTIARTAVSGATPDGTESVKPEKQDSASPFAAAPAISQDAGKPQRLSSPPADRYGFKLSMPPALMEAPSNRKRTAILVGSFAIVSLGIGWMAGRAGLRGIFDNGTSDQKAAPQASGPVAAESPNAAEIEVIDARNQRWLIPFQAPSGEHAAGASALNAPGASEARIASLSAGDESQGADTSVLSNSGNGAAVPVMRRSEAPISIVPESNQVSSATGSGLISGELLHRVEPEYPADALAQGIEGSVKLDAVIDPDGNVRTLQPISGPKQLFPAAMDAVHQWRYSPTVLDGHPIQTERQITITFQLSPAASK